MKPEIKVLNSRYMNNHHCFEDWLYRSIQDNKDEILFKAIKDWKEAKGLPKYNEATALWQLFVENCYLDFNFTANLKADEIISCLCFKSETVIGDQIIEAMVLTHISFIVGLKYYMTEENLIIYLIVVNHNHILDASTII